MQTQKPAKKTKFPACTTNSGCARLAWSDCYSIMDIGISTSERHKGTFKLARTMTFLLPRKLAPVGQIPSKVFDKDRTP